MKERVVVVFGMGPAGLFLSRQLKRDGATVVAKAKVTYRTVFECYKSIL